MNGIKFFPIHILIKDLSFINIYFLLLKYIFTEINTPITTKTTFKDMVYGALYYNIFTLVLSLISYLPIVFIID